MERAISEDPHICILFLFRCSHTTDATWSFKAACRNGLPSALATVCRAPGIRGHGIVTCPGGQQPSQR